MWLVAIVLVALIGCGTGGNGTEEPATSSTATPDAPASTPTPPAAARAWAAGDALVRSHDGGRTWHLLRSAEGLTSVSFADRLVGWAVGTRTILRSIDGGDRWTDQTGAVDANIIGSLNAVTALSPTRAVIVGVFMPRTPFYDTPGPVYRHLTTDGGLTWALTPFDPGGSRRSDEAELRRMCFTDAGLGLACGLSGSFFSRGSFCALSDDNGGSWLDISNRVGGKAVACVGNATLWVIEGRDQLLQSTDGGQTWSDRSDTLPTTRTTLDAIAFATEALGWAVGTDDMRRPLILHTSDAGSTWTSQIVPATVSGTLKAVRFVDPRNGIAIGTNNASEDSAAIGFFTTDGGDEWRAATFPPDTPGLRDLTVVP